MTYTPCISPYTRSTIGNADWDMTWRRRLWRMVEQVGIPFYTTILYKENVGDMGCSLELLPTDNPAFDVVVYCPLQMRMSTNHIVFSVFSVSWLWLV